ncbi:MAG: phosphatidylglycerophosphatase A [Patescibacteria group bacterium]
MKESLSQNLATHIVTLWGLGRKTKFPGTLASFLSLIFSFLSFYFLDKIIYVVFFFIFLVLGFWAIRKIQKESGERDHSWIVIDEWIGMWFVGFFLFELNSTLNFTLTGQILIAILGFIIFRIIDILKWIPPIGAIDREEAQTPTLIILDDVIAGCYSYAILMMVFGFYNIHYIYFSFIFLLPAMIANMTPVLLRGIKKFGKPINEKIFGSNKTWRGLVGGIIVGTLSYYILANKGFIEETQNTSYVVLVGFLISFGALTGDLMKSYFKRKVGIKEGESWIPLDQIDYILGVIIFTYGIFRYSLPQIVLLLIIGGAMSALAHRFAYFTRMINTKW